MNLTAIHLYSNLDDGTTSFKHAELNLKNVSTSDSYIIKGMSGLDSDELIHNYYSSNSGSNYYNIMSKNRVVVIFIRLNPQYGSGETNESLRIKLQKMISFTRNSLIELRFMNDATWVSSLKGHITKFESSLFSTEPEVQITFECDEPLFISPAPVTVSINTPRINTMSWSDNLSTAAHGFKMQIAIPDNIVSMKIQGISGSNYADFEFGFINNTSGGVLYFSSEKNDRYLYLIRSGTTEDLISRIDPLSVWPMMYPGQTSITIDTNMQTETFTFQSINYKPAYWGL